MEKLQVAFPCARIGEDTMKRTEELKPLSHDHFEGLAMARRIRRGLEKEADFTTIAACAARFGRTHLKHHFEQEERLLLSLLEQMEEDLAIRMSNEHEELMALAGEMEAGPAQQQVIMRFAQALKAHIRFEEREVFPLLEQRLDVNTLHQIGEALHEAHVGTDTNWDAPS